MGKLRHVHSELEAVLFARHLVGRGPACQLRLDEPKLSNVHAELLWVDASWRVRDLGSRNGTFVAGARIEPGQVVELEPGVELAFAGARACFRLIDAMPPSEPTSDGLPDTRTVEGDLRLHGLELHFSVSRDEEHIELDLREGLEVHGVEPRAHLALLLTLARMRLADHEQGHPATECGWVHRDDLAKMLAIDPTLANLWIHRARKQLSALGVRDSARVVERRAGGAQVRLGVDRIVVVKT